MCAESDVIADHGYSTVNLVVSPPQARSREVWGKGTATRRRLLDEERHGRDTTLCRSGDTARHLHKDVVVVDRTTHAANSIPITYRAWQARLNECVEWWHKWTEPLRCAVGKVLQPTPAGMVSHQVID